MIKAAVPYEAGLDRDLQDPEFAAAYLTESFKSGKDVFLIALGDVVRARGDFKGFAEGIGKARAALHRGLGSGGNPTMDTLMLVLDKLGLGVSFAPTPKSVTRRRVRKPAAKVVRAKRGGSKKPSARVHPRYKWRARKDLNLRPSDS